MNGGSKFAVQQSMFGTLRTFRSPISHEVMTELVKPDYAMVKAAIFLLWATFGKQNVSRESIRDECICSAHEVALAPILYANRTLSVI